jgi:DNA modification methylase
MESIERSKMTGAFRVLCGDARDVLATLEPGSVHIAVTSPP